MIKNLPDVILHSLMTSKQFAELAMPHLKGEYFEHTANPIFKSIQAHFKKYGCGPNVEQLLVAIDQNTDIDHYDHEGTLNRVNDVIATDTAPDLKWLIDQTEEFIGDKIQHCFVLGLITALEHKKPLPRPEEFVEAILSDFSFSTPKQLGHDLFEDCHVLYEHLTDTNERLPFDIEELNRLTNNGVTRKTLNVILAPTNVGKSLVLCHLAASYCRQGRNVLYITLEMSEKTTAQRITANMLDQDMNTLAAMGQEQFILEVANLKKRCPGSLFIREFPALSVTTTNLRSLLAELKRHKKFVPDVVMVDYLNLCGAASLGKSSKADLYQKVGTIAAELRGLATEQDVVLWTATQTNRGGSKSTELELEHTSESYAVNSTADLILGLSRDENLPNRRIVKVLKNRNDGISGSTKAVVGVDTNRMKIYDFDPAAAVAQKVTDMRKTKQSTAAARVNAKKPRFAIDDEEMAEAG